MLLKRLKIKNIRSYKEAEINFPEGSTLLMGDIGSGKTSILLAVEFALFGLQPGQKGNSLIRSNMDGAEVVLEFEVDEQKVVIERKLERGNKSISQANTAITIDNERFDGSVTEIKNKILELLNYPPEFAKKTNDLYKFTVYTPQEEMKQIILESNDVRLNTLRHIFGIDKYKRIEENTDILTARIRQEIRIKEAETESAEIKNSALTEKKQHIENQEKELKKLDEEIEAVKKIKAEKELEIKDLNKRMAEKSKLENEREKSELTLNNKKEILRTYEKEINNIEEQVKSAGSFTFNERDVENLKIKIKTNEQMLKEFNEQYISLTTSIQSDSSKIRELAILKNKISALDKCPTCLQIVNNDYKRNIVEKASQELKIIENETEKNLKSKSEVNEKIEQTKKAVEIFRQSLSQIEILKIRLEGIKEKQDRIAEMEKQKSAIFADIDMIKKHIESLNSLIKEFEAYDAIYEKKNLEFEEIEKKEDSILIKKAGASAEMQFSRKQIAELEEEIKKIAETEKKLNHMRELEFWLNNKFLEFVMHTEKNVMLRLREDFSKLFSDWFSVLVADNMAVKLDESFSPIIQQNDYEIEYNYLSGGERTAVALAYRLALNQTINSLLSKIKTRDLVILDEPTDGFSDSQLDKMRDILNQLKVRQLILVSHEQKIEGFVNSIIKLKKQEGATVIEQ